MTGPAPRRLVLVGVLLLVVGTVVPTAAEAAAPEAGSSDWRMVSGGLLHTCAIRTTGRLYCWGFDSSGQLGDGGANADQSTPVVVAESGVRWTTVSTGSEHTCGIRTTGNLYCWGSDAFGQLGDGGTNLNRNVPTLVAGGNNWTSVSAGGNHTCARRASGRLFCWGFDDFGQLGNGAPAGAATPAEVAGLRTDWAAVDAGGNHTCARRASGRLFCWGLNNFGQVGNGVSGGTRLAPTEVMGRRTDWTTFTAGGGHTCARRASGRLFCWGLDQFGQVGNGGSEFQVPVPSQVSPASDWTAVSGGEAVTCGRRRSGRLYCWGTDAVGQLGNGGANANSPTPTQVQGGATDWSKVSTSGRHVCAAITSQRLFCWGNDAAGQLGDGGLNADMSTPAQVER